MIMDKKVKIKVIFLKKNKRFFSTLIRWYKKSIYSHCEIVFSNNFCGTSSEQCNGVIYYYLKEPINESEWDIIEIECDPHEEYMIQNVFCVEEYHCKYDWLGIILCQIFPWGRQHKNKWFCSEICLYALKRISHLKKYIDSIKPHYVDPGELYNILINISKTNNKVTIYKSLENK